MVSAGYCTQFDHNNRIGESDMAEGWIGLVDKRRGQEK